MDKNVFDINGFKLPVREFKMKNIAEHSAIVLIARRGSGKTWLCKELLNYFKDIPVGVVISPTDKMTKFYCEFFPDTYIYNSYNTSIIRRLFIRQDKIIKKNSERIAKGKSKIDTRALLVMDDCLSSKGKWMKDPEITELFFNGRHFHITYILTMQFPLGITPDMRTQFDYVFLLSENFISNLRRLHDHYAGMFNNFDSFRQVFGQLTTDFGCMVIINTLRDTSNLDMGQDENFKNSFLSKVFWFKAAKTSIKQMGCEQFNKFHSKNYDNEWMDKHNGLDIDAYCNKKKKEKEALKIIKI